MPKTVNAAIISEDNYYTASNLTPLCVAASEATLVLFFAYSGVIYRRFSTVHFKNYLRHEFLITNALQTSHDILTFLFTQQKPHPLTHPQFCIL